MYFTIAIGKRKYAAAQRQISRSCHGFTRIARPINSAPAVDVAMNTSRNLGNNILDNSSVFTTPPLLRKAKGAEIALTAPYFRAACVDEGFASGVLPLIDSATVHVSQSTM
jgi:hypothetical protein